MLHVSFGLVVLWCASSSHSLAGLICRNNHLIYRLAHILSFKHATLQLAANERSRDQALVHVIHVLVNIIT